MQEALAAHFVRRGLLASCGKFWEVAQTAPAGVLCSHPLGGTPLIICARGVRGWVVPFSTGVLFRFALAVVGVCFVRM